MDGEQSNVPDRISNVEDEIMGLKVEDGANGGVTGDIIDVIVRFTRSESSQGHPNNRRDLVPRSFYGVVDLPTRKSDAYFVIPKSKLFEIVVMSNTLESVSVPSTPVHMESQDKISFPDGDSYDLLGDRRVEHLERALTPSIEQVYNEEFIPENVGEYMHRLRDDSALPSKRRILSSFLKNEGPVFRSTIIDIARREKNGDRKLVLTCDMSRFDAQPEFEFKIPEQGYDEDYNAIKVVETIGNGSVRNLLNKTVVLGAYGQSNKYNLYDYTSSSEWYGPALKFYITEGEKFFYELEKPSMWEKIKQLF